MKKIIYISVIFIVVVLGVWFLFNQNRTIAPAEILSFKDCENAGYPILESYPRQCNAPNGKFFVEELLEKITYINSSNDLISVELPFPDAVTGKEFSVIGKARGTWFFEASFPIYVLDENGSVLAVVVAQAQSDWMTVDFVAFRADIKVPESYIGPATLVFQRDNPTGLPEYDASISFPINIEY